MNYLSIYLLSDTHIEKGTWTAWRPQEMKRKAGALCFETSFKIGVFGREEFKFARDNDEAQLIYPAEVTSKNAAVPVRGPDSKGRGKHWVVEGDTGTIVTLLLAIKDGEITITVKKRGEEMSWKSPDIGDVEEYYISDYYENCTLMEAVPGNPRAKQVSLTMPEEELYFRIFVDKDPHQAIYPELSGTYVSGLTTAVGPDSFGSESFWVIQEAEGANVKITYDPTKPDPRMVVTWTVD